MHSIFDFESPNDFLNSELDRRKKRNPSYSMRSFARDLALSASRLSEVLKGAGLSEKRGVEIAKKLKLSFGEKAFWLDLILINTSSNSKVKSFALKRIEKAKKMNRLEAIKEAQFRSVADWYHAAILELTQLGNFNSDVNWIANELGLSLATVSAAVERLKLLNLLSEKTGKLTAHPAAYQTFSETPSAAIRKFHRQILTKSLESIEKDQVGDRLVQSMIVAIPRSQLPLFDQEMKMFLQNFWEKIKNTEKDDLYSVSLQMTPVRSRKLRPKID